MNANHNPASESSNGATGSGITGPTDTTGCGGHQTQETAYQTQDRDGSRRTKDMHDSTSSSSPDPDLNSDLNPELSAAEDPKLGAGEDEVPLPDRLDAGDGHGEYVYKRRGPLGRLRAKARGLVQAWLAEAAPRDAEHPPQPGTATYTLAGTWRRKAITLTAAATVGLVLALFVLVGL